MQQPFIGNPNLKQDQVTRWLLIGLGLSACLMPICFFFDLRVASTVNYKVVPSDLRTILSCAEAFGHSYGVALILLAIWTASVATRKKIQAIVGLLVANCFVVWILKNSIIRVRPRGEIASQFDSVWSTFHGINPVWTSLDFSQMGISNLQSYPSGHTSTAFILGIGLAITFPRARYLFLLFAVLSSAQRIGFSAHYLSDVCAGLMVAVVQFLVFIQLRVGRQALFPEVEPFPVVEEAGQPEADLPRRTAA